MAKNLNVSKYRNGDLIPEISDPSQWMNLTTGAWCYYANNPSNGVIYGKLYNWYAVNDPRGLAPEGWHVPTDAEWSALTTCLGGEIIAGGALKIADSDFWLSPNTDASNSSGFSGLPAGCRLYYGDFGYLAENTYWWTSTSNTSPPELAWLRTLFYNFGSVSRDRYVKHFGFSVRCLKNE